MAENTADKKRGFKPKEQKKQREVPRAKKALVVVFSLFSSVRLPVCAHHLWCNIKCPLPTLLLFCAARILAILFYLLFYYSGREPKITEDRNTKVYFSLGMFNFPETVKIRSLGQTKVALFGQAEQYRLRWSEKRIFRWNISRKRAERAAHRTS